jgi:hypothetical protein
VTALTLCVGEKATKTVMLFIAAFVNSDDAELYLYLKQVLLLSLE